VSLTWADATCCHHGVPGTPSQLNWLPAGSQVAPPSLERWITCQDQPLHCEA
jgi:hypothetical protein